MVINSASCNTIRQSTHWRFKLGGHDAKELAFCARSGARVRLSGSQPKRRAAQVTGCKMAALVLA